MKIKFPFVPVPHWKYRSLSPLSRSAAWLPWELEELLLIDYGGDEPILYFLFQIIELIIIYAAIYS
jgi:hypothetical protein